jgi:hypothetical protein
VRQRSRLPCGLVAMIGLLVSCESANVGPSAPPRISVTPLRDDLRPSASSDDILSFVASAAPGQSGSVSDARRGRLHVILEREYYSAAGIVCRRFTVAPVSAKTGNEIETRVACQEPGGWRLDTIASKGLMPASQ